MIEQPKKIDIRPGVNVLGIFQYLNYKPWYALAEFVDNALQSYLDNADSLRAIEGPDYRLRVDIDLKTLEDASQTIVIRDNAGGIAEADLARALKTAEPPSNRDGLSEFGVGMKSAAFWYSPVWEVLSTALGENTGRTVRFNIDEIVANQYEAVDVAEWPSDPETQFTEVRLLSVQRRISAPRTINKIRSHLASIYRRFLQNGQIQLFYDLTEIRRTEPAILVAPVHSDLNGEQFLWKKLIDFDFGNGQSVKGFAALRSTMSASEAGFSLFRRSRLIQGSADEPYRPSEIFGDATRFRFRRLFGELELSGFDVTHTKDGFRWGDAEDAFLQLLMEHLIEPPLDLISQAENYRARRSATDPPEASALQTAATAMAAVNISDATKVIEESIAAEDADPQAAEQLPPGDTGGTFQGAFRDFSFQLDGRTWQVRLSLDERAHPDDLFILQALPDHASEMPGLDAIVRVHLNHPLLARVVGPDAQGLGAILELLAATCIGELIARERGIRFPGTIRRAINGLLR